jgi:AAA family ATP:ADP antiporter
MPAFKTLGEAQKSGLERLLSVFADVRAGEGVAALLMTANIFLLPAAYSLLKPAREALILTEGTAVTKVQSSAIQAVLLVGIVPLFGWLASRVNRIRLITTTSLFSAANLLVFYALGQAQVREGVAFFVWVGIFNVFIVSQFWAFANDFYTEGQGRRLFPMIGVGASLGAWIGSTSVPPLIDRFAFTPYTLQLLAAIVLVVALGITYVVNHQARQRNEPEAARIEATPLGKEGGFQLILQDRYLMLIAVLVILLNVVNTTGEFLLGSLVRTSSLSLADANARSAYIGAFYGSYYGLVNLVGFLLQLFVTSRVMRFMGVRGALFILPTLAFVNYSIIAVVPILAIVRIGKILENGTDYSIHNTIRQTLFLPTSREVKYKAKAAIDTLGQRLGDVAGRRRLGTFLGMALAGFAWVNVGLTVVWLFVAAQIAREHRRKTVQPRLLFRTMGICAVAAVPEHARAGTGWARGTAGRVDERRASSGCWPAARRQASTATSQPRVGGTDAVIRLQRFRGSTADRSVNRLEVAPRGRPPTAEFRPRSRGDR